MGLAGRGAFQTEGGEGKRRGRTTKERGAAGGRRAGRVGEEARWYKYRKKGRLARESGEQSQGRRMSPECVKTIDLWRWEMV